MDSMVSHPHDDLHSRGYDSRHHAPAAHSSLPFEPLPVDDSAPNTPPHAYSSYNYLYPKDTSPHPSPAMTHTASSFPPLAPAPEPKPRSRWASFWATYKTTNQLSFLAVFGLQAVTVLVMILLIYITIHNNIGDLRASELLALDPQLESVATYVSLFILAVVFELLVILDACQQKNIIGILCIVIFQFALLVYSAVLPRQLANALDGSNADTPTVRHLVQIYAVVIPAVIGACSLALTYLAWRLYEEFGWDVFKRIGADIKIRKCYQTYEIFVAVLKFDAYAFIGFEIQFLVLVTGTKTAEFVLTIIALPIILVALALTAVVVRIESRTGVYASLLCQTAGMAYFAFKLARIYSNAAGERYATAQATLTMFSVISLVMLVTTFVLTGLCMSNFGRGLKERIPGYAFNGGRSFLPNTHTYSNPDRTTSTTPRYKLEAPEPLYAQGGGGGVRRESGMGRSETRMSID
ncbi:uncharacterized protein JCM15063_002381 [Sporobolomyces koalae]|uniref:uncharacterized protein n=1 Tax=Sporobolomyces koalae TaxID=500713 RepID=UPI00317588D6